MNKKMTGKELVEFARSKIGVSYVYGTKGEILTQEKFDYLQKTYGMDYVWQSDEKKIGNVCVDCSGLISWACGVMRGSSQWKEKATKVMSIKDYKNVPVGALVWMQGHIGVYSGMKNGEPYYIAADGSAYGVREVSFNKNKFTHILLDEDVFDYGQESDDEMIEKDIVIINGEEYTMELIRKDDYTFIKTRDICSVLNLEVNNEGKIPIINSRK